MPGQKVVHIEDVSEPFCGCRRKSMVPLSDKEPEIAAEWCYEKNCGWGPQDFSSGSGVRAWWECPRCMRTYKSSIANRTTVRSACPYCASKRVCEDNALTMFNPEIAAEWHPTKNGKTRAEDLTRASSKKFWWRCSTCNHSWKCAIADRTTLGSGCPACYEARMEQARLHPNRHPTRQIVLDESSQPAEDWYEKQSNGNFVSLYSHSKKLAREWHPTKNGAVTAIHVTKGSDAIAWWKCPKGPDHEWQSPVYNRTRHGNISGCPYCLNLRLSVTNSLANKAPKVAKEWHPSKNGKLTPKDVTAVGRRKKYWWQCSKDKSHVWQASIYYRVKGRGCHYCNHVLVSKDNCLNREFAYIAAQLHPTKNGKLTGNDITASSAKKVWWKCDKGPDHEWMATPGNRTWRGSGCPACEGRQISVTNCLATLFPEKAKQWDKKRNKTLTPDTVSPHSKETVWWQCTRGHRWAQIIRGRVSSPIECWVCIGRTSTGVPGKRPKKGVEKTNAKQS